jgi:hypothetical protein
MRGRLIGSLLGLSLAVNAIAVYLILSPDSPSPLPTRPDSPPPAQPPRIVKTNVLVSATPFHWNQVESEDYETYIANLRGIGCPEPTIRDIIVAEVNQLFARRRATEIATPDQQWWRSNPDPEVVRAAARELASLESERRVLLTHLLGDDWHSAGNAFPVDEADPNPLNGPLLGTLDPDVKAGVRDVTRIADQRLQDYLDRTRANGESPNPAELARLGQQARAELALLLPPSHLEEYLLRYSDDAGLLRDQLQGIDVSPDQFRSLFRARDEATQVLISNSSGNLSPSTAREIETNLNATIRETLGQEAFEYYQLNQDEAFQQARHTIEQLDADPAAVLPLYEINRLSDAEARRIENDPTLTPEERTDALFEVQKERQNSLRSLIEALRTNRTGTTTETPAPLPPTPPPPSGDYTP